MVWFIRISTGTCHFCSFVGTWTHLFWIFSFGAVVFRFFFWFERFVSVYLRPPFYGVSSPWIDQLATGGHYSKWLNETGLVEAFAFDGTHQVQHLPGFDRCPIMSPRGWLKHGGSPMKFATLMPFWRKNWGKMIHQILGCESHVTFQSLWLLGEHGNWNSMTTCHRPLLLKCENHRKPGCKVFDIFWFIPAKPRNRQNVHICRCLNISVIDGTSLRQTLPFGTCQPSGDFNGDISHFETWQ